MINNDYNYGYNKLDHWERDMHDDIIRSSQYISIFKIDNKVYYQYIDPDTPRYHVNKLFNQMIDYCITNKLIDENGKYLISKNTRDAFYRYCYKYT